MLHSILIALCGAQSLAAPHPSARPSPGAACDTLAVVHGLPDGPHPTARSRYRFASPLLRMPGDGTLELPLDPGVPVDTPVARRPRAIEYSDWYNTRLTIHRWGSYVELPLFGAEYALGQNLINDTYPARWMKSSHKGVAGAITALFVVNTVTGVWNLWDSRSDPSGRARRLLHSALMLASDAGFVWTGQSARPAKLSTRDARHHEAIAVGSMGLATAGTVLMWFWKD